METPSFALRAYALFFWRHGTKEPFSQSELDWIVSVPMKKKIFSVLLRSGWVAKVSRTTYRCVDPRKVFRDMLQFRVTEVVKNARKPYALTGLSAIEIWSDYSYIQRSIEKSPYFIKVLKKDVTYWKRFFNQNSVPNYVNRGTTIGEYVILMPVNDLKFVEKQGLKVEPLKEAARQASQNEMFGYAYDYIKQKYGAAI